MKSALVPNIRTRLAAGFALILAAAAPNLAAASTPITGTLSIQYFAVPIPCYGSSGAQACAGDFNAPSSNWTTPNVANGSSLGPDGFPVVTQPNPGISTFNASNEITWWNPSATATATQPIVNATGAGTFSITAAATPVSMFPPNSTGTNNANGFQTAVLMGNLYLNSTGDVSINLGSDDDSFVYLDGTLVDQNPGVHAYQVAPIKNLSNVSAGNHILEIFYADRHVVDAKLGIGFTGDGNVSLTAVPEPATWLCLLVGAGLTGAALRKRRAEVPLKTLF
jgi:hypothetical protein